MKLRASLDTIDVLDAETCASLRDRVHALKPHWRQRHPGFPFFTLGAASYLDCSHGRVASYAASAGQDNPILWDHFQDVYDHLARILEGYLLEPVEYTRTWALPGFHVFLGDPSMKHAEARIHFDLQFEDIDWRRQGTVDVSRTLSFTLGIQLPQAGGGMNVWDVHRREIPHLGGDEYPAHVHNLQRHHHPYAVGGMVVHDGLYLHQIAQTPVIHDGDERITLQGHGTLVDNVWQLYW